LHHDDAVEGAGVVGHEDGGAAKPLDPFGPMDLDPAEQIEERKDDGVLE
jgi:hypothetical protein